MKGTSLAASRILTSAVAGSAALVGCGAAVGWHLGGPHGAVALAVAVALLAFEILLAVTPVVNSLQDMSANRELAVGFVPAALVLLYAAGQGIDWRTTMAGLGYAVLPVVLARLGQARRPGAWTDWVTTVVVWIPIQFQWLYAVFSQPPSLSATLAVLLALATGAAAFVLIRRLNGVGYSLAWRREYLPIVAVHFGAFAVMAIPLGLAMHFLVFAPAVGRLKLYPLAIVGFLLFVAWPEEFLFRGLGQNLLTRVVRNRWVGLALASIIFGLSHVTQPPAPNWRYVLLATLAGLFYGRVWMQTGSLLAAALVHALVDATWFTFFPSP